MQPDAAIVVEFDMDVVGTTINTTDFTVNGSDSYSGLDVIDGVNFFKGGDDPMCDSCLLCPDRFYCGDVNGSYSFNGLDITYRVNYLKGGAAPIPCPDCPPIGDATVILKDRDRTLEIPRVCKEGNKHHWE